jgi:hypothetical protein
MNGKYSEKFMQTVIKKQKELLSDIWERAKLEIEIIKIGREFYSPRKTVTIKARIKTKDGEIIMDFRPQTLSAGDFLTIEGIEFRIPTEFNFTSSPP